jgi:ESCRT-II complex subunit VPS36
MASVPLASPLQSLSLTASSLGSHLLPHEEILSLCPSIGLYTANVKLPQHQDGTVYLTSHRIIYVDELDSRKQSGFLELQSVKMMEYYKGFLKSSPKVVLEVKTQQESQDASGGLKGEVARLQDQMGSMSAGSSSSSAPSRWLCPVCGFSNTNTTRTTGDQTPESCQLCGVKRDLSATASSSQHHILTPAPLKKLSASAPSTTPSSPSPSHVPPLPAKGAGPEVPCPTCTFLNHPSIPRCEICDSPLGIEDLSVPTPTVSKSAMTTRPPTPVAPPESIVVKLSFRRGGDKAFYDALRLAMQRAAWKRKPSTSQQSNGSQGTANGLLRAPPPRTATPTTVDIDGRKLLPTATSGTSTPVIGIDGLMQAYNTKSTAQSEDISTAMKDLRVLMSKAKDMVDLAESLNAKLSRREAELARANPSGNAVVGEEEEEAATLIRSSLVKLGLPTTAITQEMAKDEEEYHMELARELGFVLFGKEGGSGGAMGKGRVLQKGQDALRFAKWQQESQVQAHSDLIETMMGGGTDEVDVKKTLDRDIPPSSGILGLDSLWLIWNRLRGIALVSPSTLLSTLPHLERITCPPIRLRVFTSSPAGSAQGLKVLYRPEWSEEKFQQACLALLLQMERDAMYDQSTSNTGGGGGITRIADDLFLPEPVYAAISPLELSQRTKIPLMLIRELLIGIEVNRGTLVRDDGPPTTAGGSGGAEAKWMRNRFQELAV